MHLVVLENRGVRRLLLVEAHVENRMKAVIACQYPPQLPLLDANNMPLLPAPVADTRDHSFTAHAPRIAASPALALAYGQLDSLAGRGGEAWPTTPQPRP